MKRAISAHRALFCPPLADDSVSERRTGTIKGCRQRSLKYQQNQHCNGGEEDVIEVLVLLKKKKGQAIGCNNRPILVAGVRPHRIAHSLTVSGG